LNQINQQINKQSLLEYTFLIDWK